MPTHYAAKGAFGTRLTLDGYCAFVAEIGLLFAPCPHEYNYCLNCTIASTGANRVRPGM
jgi:hypothetical protein